MRLLPWVNITSTSLCFQLVLLKWEPRPPAVCVYIYVCVRLMVFVISRICLLFPQKFPAIMFFKKIKVWSVHMLTNKWYYICYHQINMQSCWQLCTPPWLITLSLSVDILWYINICLATRGRLGQSFRPGNLTCIQAIPYTHNKFWNHGQQYFLYGHHHHHIKV